ncbi:MAG: CCA tRNA nucleotidyltransferase [Gemmatimonadota bacterium]|nr:MAG: CCA tRNA nucleotidyltransferase [Gemmatimonadota bacterium]
MGETWTPERGTLADQYRAVLRRIQMPFPSKLPIPAEVLRIAERLEGAGFETWCVGGAVRDNLLGYVNKDFDLATAATPRQVTGLFRRTIPIGIDHGTVAVLDKNRRPHEVTTFRRDVKTDGRHAVVEFGVSLEADLARRDFTMNAIAYHPTRFEWRDPLAGAADLEAKVIRAVGNPVHRFREDYLRILRALRFAARFGFAIEPETWNAAVENAVGLRHLSAERVREEWFRGLQGAQRPSELVRLWSEVGALEVWLPELQCGAPGAVPERLRVADRIEGQDPVLITAYLSDNPGATLARLKCSNVDTERAAAVGRYVTQHPDPGSPAHVRRWMAQAGSAVDDLVAIWVAQGADARLRVAVKRIRASGAPLTLGELAVDGEDLLAAGIEQGPEVGRILQQLLDEVLQEPELNSRTRLLQRALDLRARDPLSAPPSPAKDRSDETNARSDRG